MPWTVTPVSHWLLSHLHSAALAEFELHLPSVVYRGKQYPSRCSFILLAAHKETPDRGMIRLLFEVLILRALFAWTFTYGNSSLVDRLLVCRPVASLSHIPVFTDKAGKCRSSSSSSLQDKEKICSSLGIKERRFSCSSSLAM
jgi:hypothetical protein